MRKTSVSKGKYWDGLRRLGDRLGRSTARVAMPRKPRVHIVDRLFGDMTHFCFVVELERKPIVEHQKP